ncbi:MAG: radical SAM-associated putative lipoprotein [Alistipes sp.]|nr:radical SAM-associated putative lipoprotein [Alistipes sp.]
MKRFIYFLFVLLGFGAVACDNDWFDVVAEYGCPHMNFSFKARVIDEAGKPIEGIEVQTRNGDFYMDNFSDAEGNIDLNVSMWPDTNIDLVFTDVDGAENGGEFETLNLNIADKVEQVAEGSGSWYEGGYKADLGDVTMTLKAKRKEKQE